MEILRGGIFNLFWYLVRKRKLILEEQDNASYSLYTWTSVPRGSSCRERNQYIFIMYRCRVNYIYRLKLKEKVKKSLLKQSSINTSSKLCDYNQYLFYLTSSIHTFWIDLESRKTQTKSNVSSMCTRPRTIIFPKTYQNLPQAM